MAGFPSIYTIGHSTRELDKFIELLRQRKIRLLLDVRILPGSRRVPHFNSAELARSLLKDGIQYKHMKELGGLRKPVANSVNLGWRNTSFRGFADYMQSATFWQGIEEALQRATQEKTALMCAEAVPWRCHRSLIADALLLKHAEVLHIISAGDVRNHKLTEFAVVQGDRIIYPEPENLL